MLELEKTQSQVEVEGGNILSWCRVNIWPLAYLTRKAISKIVAWLAEAGGAERNFAIMNIMIFSTRGGDYDCLDLCMRQVEENHLHCVFSIYQECPVRLGHKSMSNELVRILLED